MRLYLIGFMGSGKTHTGRQLAERLGIPFFDLDHLIEDAAGMSVSGIFEQYGEQHFRRLEQKELHATRALKAAVISTGGGAPCFFDNMDWMNRHGTSIYLRTPPEILALRLMPERAHRPLLQPYDESTLPAFIESKVAERTYIYEQAKIIYDQEEAEADVAADLLQLIDR